MAQQPSHVAALERIPTGISGLDTILKGGLIKGGLYLVRGVPGSGKTILGNQLCFNHVAKGEQAIYLTLLTETHSRMLAYLQSFSFFTLAPLTTSLNYLSGYTALEQGGLDALLALIRQELRQQSASLLVIDGAFMAARYSSAVSDWQRFLHSLTVYAETLHTTIVFLMQFDNDHLTQPEYTMVDGILELSIRTEGIRTTREFQVRKFRGSSFLEGRHLMTINQHGITTYPRTETLPAVVNINLPTILNKTDILPRQMTGIARLDEMLNGGLPTNSNTIVLGSMGTGKTILGLNFLLAGAEQGQKGLYFGCYETPAQLIRKMNLINKNLGSAVENGQIELQWQSPLEDIIDIMAERIIQTLRQTGAKRLFIDGLETFQRTLASTERIDLFITALFTILRTFDVTAICSVSTTNLMSPNVTFPAKLHTVISQGENLIFVRQVELHSQLHRLISILKMRESGYDPSIREFRISEKGVEVASTFASAQAILTGIARPLGDSPIPPFDADASPSRGQVI